MSVESAKKFISDFKTNEDLAKKVQIATETENPEEVISIAQANGYNFTQKELEEALIGDEELTLDDMEAVAGGNYNLNRVWDQLKKLT